MTPAPRYEYEGTGELVGFCLSGSQNDYTSPEMVEEQRFGEKGRKFDRLDYPDAEHYEQRPLTKKEMKEYLRQERIKKEGGDVQDSEEEGSEEENSEEESSEEESSEAESSEYNSSDN